MAAGSIASPANAGLQPGGPCYDDQTSIGFPAPRDEPPAGPDPGVLGRAALGCCLSMVYARWSDNDAATAKPQVIVGLRVAEAVTLATLPDFARVAPRVMVATVKIIAYGVERGLEIEPRDLVIVHHRLEA